MADQRALAAFMRPFARRISMMLARGTVALSSAAGKMQTLQMRLLAGEVKDGMEHFEAYGFTSNPKPGAEGIAVFFDGDRSHGVVLVAADRRFRLKNLEPGEVALYTDEGDKLIFKRGNKIRIETTTLEVVATNMTLTGTLTAGGDVVAGTVSLKHHVHSGVTGGPSNTGQPV